MKKIFFWLKQLLPFTYHSEYSVGNGKRQVAIWKQWFFKPFNIRRYAVAN